MKLPVVWALVALAAVHPARTHAVWLDEVPITATPTDSESGLNHSPLAYDTEGGLTVVWAERDTPNQNYQIYTRRRAWAAFDSPRIIVSYPDPQPGSLLGAKYPSIAATGDSLLIAWHDYRHGGIRNAEIYARALALDGGLGAELRLTTTLNSKNPGDNGYVPTVAVASDGIAHVVWYDFRWDPNRADIFHKRRASGGWVTPLGDSSDVNVSRTIQDGFNSGAPALAPAAAGAVHAVWAEQGQGVSRIRHARFDPGTGWSAPATVAQPAATAEAPTAAVDPAGTLHVVWVDGRHPAHSLYTRSLPAGGSWGAELRLTPTTVEAGDPGLISTADGALHLVWQDARMGLDNREIFYRRREPGAGWDVSGAGDVRLSDAADRSDRPSITADASANLAVLWRDRRSGANDLYLREFRPQGPIGVPEPGPAWISVTAPLVRGPNPWQNAVWLDGPPGEPVIVFDLGGRAVAEIGPSIGFWDGRDAGGRRVPPGVYFLRGRVSARVARVVRVP
jgi:hypothetical protein